MLRLFSALIVAVLFSGCGNNPGNAPGTSATLASQTRESTHGAVTLRSTPIGSVAQSFSLADAGSVHQVQLKLAVQGTRPAAPSGFSVQVTIESNTRLSGLDRPSGTLVDPSALAKLNFDKITSEQATLYTFTFPAVFSLAKGGPYWIHVNVDYPILSIPNYSLVWSGENDASSSSGSSGVSGGIPGGAGTSVYELLNQPGTYLNGLGANQQMFFIVGS